MDRTPRTCNHGVGVITSVPLGTGVQVDVGVCVAVDVGVRVGVDVRVGVRVEVAVDVFVGVSVAVDVLVGVDVGVANQIPPTSSANTKKRYATAASRISTNEISINLFIEKYYTTPCNPSIPLLEWKCIAYTSLPDKQKTSPSARLQT
jgi:hypothetical protein